jgi:hypothetical protein
MSLMNTAVKIGAGAAAGALAFKLLGKDAVNGATLGSVIGLGAVVLLGERAPVVQVGTVAAGSTGYLPDLAPYFSAESPAMDDEYVGAQTPPFARGTVLFEAGMFVRPNLTQGIFG